MRYTFFLILLLFLIHPTIAEDEYTEMFGDHEGTFVIYDLNRDVMQVYNPQRANERFSPFSTFKVPHAAIALETGTVDADFVMEHNENRYPFEVGMERFFTPSLWGSDHTLRSALQFSIVWYFREMAGLIGQEMMQSYLSQFDYGNQDISVWDKDDGIASFWLNSSLEISAIEQVLFLSALYQGELGLSETTTETLLDMMTQYQTEDYRLMGKTGTRAGDLSLAWFIGIIEQGENVYIFAFNVEGEPSVRSRLLRDILVGQGYMPEASPLFQS